MTAPGGGDRRDRTVLAAAIASAVALVAAYLALGGAGYKPLEVADPCDPRPAPEGAETELLEQLALSALDGAACALRVPREELALAIADPEQRAEFAEQYNLTDEALEAAVRAGLLRAVDDAEANGRISALEATLLREAAERLPVAVVIDALQTEPGRSALDVAEDLLRQLAD